MRVGSNSPSYCRVVKVTLQVCSNMLAYIQCSSMGKVGIAMRLSLVEYKKRKESLKRTLKINDNQFVDMVKGGYDEGAMKVASISVASVLNKMSGKSIGVLSVDVLNDWDFVWYFKRNLHIVIPEVEYYVIPKDGIDTSCLNKLDKDINIDTTIKDKPVFIRLVHRNIPVEFRASVCYWTIDAYTDTDNVHFSFVGGGNVRKVYVDSIDMCIQCGMCSPIECKNGVQHVIRPRFRENCTYSSVLLDPMMLLAICMKVTSTYVNREKVVKSKKQEDVSRARNIMVAREESSEGTERLMSMFEYVKEYHESVKKEWQGGHHASPVSHTRSGYYRKSKVGSYVLREGEFVFVGKSLGRYTYVQPTIVNAHKDTVMAEIM